MKLTKCIPIVLFDMDGTLTRSRQPIELEMGELFAELTHNTTVGIMSGGGFEQFERQLLSRLPDSTDKSRLYIFPVTSAQCYVWKDGVWESVYDLALTKDEYEKIKKAIDVALSKTSMVEGVPMWGERLENRGAQISFAALGAEAPIDEKEKWDPKGLRRKPFRDRLRTELPDFEIHIGGTTTVDITKKGIDKAYGVRWLSKHTGVPIKDMLFVGDALHEGGNDAVVIPTGIETRQVSGPKETATVIEELCVLCKKTI
ncbi:hypothetical protein A2673_01665 [Candidatus Kaiserbacteria bacterium RIFCSPHIGHO2_01_FULL_50_13]|uniref:phosphomannomutase n=1 Tax=Candidatus Kaiserbacteria bacterium RIFCSPLOWO2_01_FULL_50_24 TaxID=1798507 RepID=A0A1F6EMH9_9BACT|nr:MAG: hypothetical protein A2673_01665 [Candidatus Kaiserbacteria bacterium RIFCSPHIGHO2_01_FULL_50_13]OGG74837.1 MAG: hypothetical protein A3A34_00365 [Candidatus Kaiserbacteria bacterium RIFCSPLOWO2_01_FULL_50_24]OGG81439.1 MAG: hypothetical protein A3H74_03150 [Candidatus Kaiserbacteria bacterium RIFCSPLOWO2_02_FULL_51_13]